MNNPSPGRRIDLDCALCQPIVLQNSANGCSATEIGNNGTRKSSFFESKFPNPGLIWKSVPRFGSQNGFAKDSPPKATEQRTFKFDAKGQTRIFGSAGVECRPAATRTPSDSAGVKLQLLGVSSALPPFKAKPSGRRTAGRVQRCPLMLFQC